MHVVCIAASRPLKKEKKPPRRLMELSVCLEELMDTPTFKRFNNALDAVLEAAEDMDLASIRGVCVVHLLFMWVLFDCKVQVFNPFAANDKDFCIIALLSQNACDDVFSSCSTNVLLYLLCMEFYVFAYGNTCVYSCSIDSSKIKC